MITDVNELGEATARAIGGDTLFVRQDVRDEEQWRGLVAMVMERFGRLDVLVNNAGVLVSDDIETATRRGLAVRAVGERRGDLPRLQARHPGDAGQRRRLDRRTSPPPRPSSGSRARPAYTASKGAIQALTRSIAVYCLTRGYRIRCNAIYPHLAESPMSRSHGGTVKLVPPTGVANAVLFLASDESSDLNGTFLNLDRGTSCLVGELPDLPD